MRSRLYQLVILLLTVAFLILPQSLYCENIRGINVVPDQEQRSCIQTVDGYAYLSEDMTLAETRASAYANAKRQALEAAMTYIQSKTKVENFQLEYDLITSDAEGSVTILEQKDHGVEEDGRYHVWIKAEVSYNLRPNKEGAVQTSIMNEDAPLTVKVWTNKKHYRRAETIEVFVQGNRDFYARIVDITPGGQIIQILPNKHRMNNYFEGGKIYSIPGEEDRFDLQVMPPYGEDHIVVYASEVPLGEVAMDSFGQGLSLYRGQQDELALASRGISVVGLTSREDRGAEFYEASWIVTTSR